MFVTTADLYRQDLANAGYGDGYHGFSLDINWSVFPSATYSINVYAVNATGGLTLLSGCPKTYTVTGTSSNVFYGKLDLNDQFTTTLNSGQIHIYTFVPIQTDYYNIFTTGSTDTYGELYNSEFVILNQNDDNDNAYNFKLQHKLYQGVTYYIYVKGYATNTSGNYTINIQSAFFDKMQELQDMAKIYTNNNSALSVELTMQFIRITGYNSNYDSSGWDKWSLAAGPINHGFESYVTANNTDLFCLLSLNKEWLYSSTLNILTDFAVKSVWDIKRIDNNGNATSTTLELSDVQYQAICQAYADFIWAKKIAENS